MSDLGPLPPSAIPLTPDHARSIALSLKWLAQSYDAAGMTFQASRAERDSQWWLGFALTLR